MGEGVSESACARYWKGTGLHKQQLEAGNWKYKPARLKNNKGEYLNAAEKGTQPNNYYIRSYKKV